MLPLSFLFPTPNRMWCFVVWRPSRLIPNSFSLCTWSSENSWASFPPASRAFLRPLVPSVCSLGWDPCPWNGTMVKGFIVRCPLLSPFTISFTSLIHLIHLNFLIKIPVLLHFFIASKNFPNHSSLECWLLFSLNQSQKLFLSLGLRIFCLHPLNF